MADDDPKFAHLNLKVCRVCSSSTDVFFHFGVLTCGACGDFFKRHSTAETFNFYCSQPSKCSLNRTAAQKVCTRCRYIRCLELGMHPKYKNKGGSMSVKAEPRTFDATDVEKVEELRKECQAAFMEDKPLDLTVCRVCFSPNNLCINFGVRTCCSCRVFFRRQCIASTFDFHCSTPGECLRSKTATTEEVCKRCRLIRCLQLGMHPKYKNSGGFTIMIFAEPRTFDATDEEKVEELRKECQAAFMEDKPNPTGHLEHHSTDQPTTSAATEPYPSPHSQEEGEPEAQRQRIE